VTESSVALPPKQERGHAAPPIFHISKRRSYCEAARRHRVRLQRARYKGSQHRAAEALSITASLRGYFDDLLSPPRPKRTVKMERVVSSVKNCQMVLTRIGETTPSFSEIRNRRALPRIGDLIVFLVAGELVHVRVEQISAPPQGEGTFVVSLKEVVAEGRSL
jgi:hypothetical protein